ncbi:MAG: hypothetical protein ACRDCE_16880 [Cetobacterium sp.]|uniref:hypothetical protein n=1 Tax=Cetobacterium sp. TaxID=2071632 RepID=UPI003EE77326
MKKLRNVFIIFLGLFLMTGCLKSEAEKNQDRVNKILNHMEKKYGEKFYMSSPFGGRGKNDALRIMVKPERYRGTAKEYDDFYEDYAFIKTDGKIGDAFGTVYLKEGAEEYFKPKLKELFGENVLIAIVLDGRYVFADFKEEMKRRSNVYNSNPIGNYSPLSGGIYIFGRVENEEDREHYRKQIYEFIQYLKAENMFDYVNLEILITEDRFLGKAFNESKDKGIIENTKTAYKRYAYIGKVLSQYNEDFEETPQSYKDKILNSKIKTNMFEQIAKKGIILLGAQIYSPKYIISRGWNKTDRKELYEEVKEYDKVDEVKFFSESYEYKSKQGEDR